MANNPLTASFTKHPQKPLQLTQKDKAILLLRQPCAQAAGVDAIVQLGISEGELAPDQLEHLAVLTTRLTNDLEALAAFMDDLGIADQGGSHE